ncbi:MAG: hypothetical protein ACREPM_09835 [Gemmatimonadaceae bacterium]
MRLRFSYTFVVAVAWSVACGRTAPPASTPIRLPARVVSDRFVATPVTTNGDTLDFFLDTGGGLNMLWPSAVARLKLSPKQVELGGDDGGSEKWGAVDFPRFVPAASIPSAMQSMLGERLGVPPTAESLDSASARDGFLGRFWFADRIWVLDYPTGQLAMWPAGTPALPAGPHQTRLGFLSNVVGHRSTQFPRIRVLVDGDSVDMLFDTGATITLTPSAAAALGDGGPTSRGGSFVAQSVFERWRSRHPDWRVIEGADSLGRRALPMIEVPAVSVGGYTVGPSWWAMRPDVNYAPYKEWMDRPIHASVGGSVLHFFRVTLDYPHAVATFER